MASWPSSRWSSAAVPGARRGAWTAPGPPSWSAWPASGTWSFELATGALHRSDTLEELYRDVGVEPDAAARRRRGRAGRAAGPALRGGHAAPRRPRRAAAARRRAAQLPGRGRVRRPTAPRSGWSAWSATSAPARPRPARTRASASPTSCRVVPTGVGRARPGRPSSRPTRRCARCSTRPRAAARDGRGRALAAEPPTGGLPELAAAGAARRRSTATRSRPCRCCAATARPCGASWPSRRPRRTTAAGSGCWPVTDVSEQRRAAELLRSAGTVDELTRLPNRAACLELLDRLLARPGRDRRRRRLRRPRRLPARQLLARPRGGRRPARHAGRAAAARAAGRLHGRPALRRRVRGDLRRPRRGGRPRRSSRAPSPTCCAPRSPCGAGPVQLTASVGVAPRCRPATSRAADLLRFAEAAMHDAKRGAPRRRRAGHRRRRRLRHPRRWSWRPSCGPRSPRTGWCWSTSRWSGPDGLVCTAEALVRWPHPERGLIPPGEFLPVAQRGGLLRELDELGAAHRVPRGRRLARARRPPASPWRSTSPACCRATRSSAPPCTDARRGGGPALGPAGARGRRDQPRRPARARARRHGPARRSAGSGSPSTTSAPATRRWPGSRSCPRRSSRSTARSSAASPPTPRTSRSRARSSTWRKAMGRSTVAEGVETTEQYHVLRGIGVDAYQGWLFARSLPPRQLRELLAGGRVAVPGRGTDPPCGRQRLHRGAGPLCDRGRVTTRSRELCRVGDRVSLSRLRRPARRRR